MSDEDPMANRTHEETDPEKVSPGGAPEALATRACRELRRVNAGLPAAESSVMLSRLGLRLALRNHPVKVRVTPPASEEAARIVFDFLEERRRANSPEPALDTLGARQGVPLGSDVPGKRSKRNAGRSEEGLAAPQESLAGESRECRLCGVSFEVNSRHRNAHVFCSARCRVRSYRRGKGLTTPQEAKTPAGLASGFGGCGAVCGGARG